ncbi:MAG: 4-hydroxyphenylpyruvate dioxygenase [Rickettsiaceae bacterium]|jgi:4-hydroxyphenylpyruvate dioxygenase|nr:4-hydroxyphenylpyruvate dioxygenase [Rickettsiaceae bacterium]
MGTDGFEFVEFAAADHRKMEKLFQKLGFTKIARHKSKNVRLYRQGDINFIINSEPNSHAWKFQEEHHSSVNSMAFRVKDAAKAYKKLLELGAKPYESDARPMEINIPAIRGIGGSLIYLVDMYGDKSIYDIDFIPEKGVNQHPKGAGLTYIDHLTHNVMRGNMNKWAGFYEKFFNFKEIRYFDIEGKLTGLLSRAMTSPCGKIRIPINESTDDKSQIEEFLHEYNGEGIQHIALGTDNIYKTVEEMRGSGVKFMDTPDTYYEQVNTRIPNHGENLERLKKDAILIDGEVTKGKKDILLQIFTDTVIGPVFFEIIQRKGNEGFGEGNFKALFESIEADQIKRGVLKE